MQLVTWILSVTMKKCTRQKRSLIFLNLRTKNCFVTRFVEALKGYICSYFANLEREIAESFDGFWKVTVDDHVYIRWISIFHKYS